MNRPAAILFDWDNTLIDSWPSIHSATNAVMAAMGHPLWSFEETKVRVRKSLRDTFPAMFGDRWEEARAVYYRHFRANHLNELAAMPGVAEMIAALAAEGIYLGVVSNKDGTLLRAEVAHLGWERHFGALVGAGDAARDKPARDPVDLALAPFGHPAGPDVWYVGDTNIDMECAAAADCIPVLLRAHAAAADEFASHAPRHVFTRPDEVTSFLGVGPFSATPKTIL